MGALVLTGCRRSAVHAGSGPVITLVAGTGQEGFSGDGGPAPLAQLWEPSGIALTSNGDLYIADNRNQRVRKVKRKGIITTVAGTGHVVSTVRGIPYGGWKGDGGPAIRADLNNPNGLAVDAKGDLYLADSGNNRIRKVSPTGIITTVAGTGAYGYSGDGGPALKAKLAFPFDVKLDRGGSLYIADTGNMRIRKVDSQGIITTYAGNGTYGFSGDGGPAVRAQFRRTDCLAFDPHGNLLVCDEENHRIRKVDSQGIVTTVAGSGPVGQYDGGYGGDGGPALQARLNSPSGVACDAAGNLFLSDRANHRVRKVDTQGRIFPVAGNGGGQWWRVFHGYGDNGSPLNASLAYPRGLAVDAQGDLYVADSGNDRVRKIPGAGAPDVRRNRAK